MRPSSAAAALAAAVAIVAGCGGESAFTVQADTTVSPRASLTKANFIDEADEICMENWHALVEAFLDKRNDLRRSEPDLTDEEQFGQATRSAYLPTMESHIVSQIRELGAPSGERRGWKG
jgi:hypothetical protein